MLRETRSYGTTAIGLSGLLEPNLVASPCQKGAESILFVRFAHCTKSSSASSLRSELLTSGPCNCGFGYAAGQGNSLPSRRTLPNKRFDAKVLVYESCRGTGNYSGLDSTLVLVFGKMPVRAGPAAAFLPTLFSRYSTEREL